jgi:predicted nuclease with TOPRIM domain
MEDQLRRRLEELKQEFEAGQAKLRELESQQVYTREVLLRISGAIQVLEEALAQETNPAGAASAPDSPAAETNR